MTVVSFGTGCAVSVAIGTGAVVLLRFTGIVEAGATIILLITKASAVVAAVAITVVVAIASVTVIIAVVAVVEAETIAALFAVAAKIFFSAIAVATLAGASATLGLVVTIVGTSSVVSVRRVVLVESFVSVIVHHYLFYEPHGPCYSLLSYTPVYVWGVILRSSSFTLSDTLSPSINSRRDSRVILLLVRVSALSAS